MTEDSPFQIDATKLLSYLNASGGQCSVADIKLYSGADPLRLYPLIYRLSLSNHLKITAYDSWGSPLSVSSLKSSVFRFQSSESVTTPRTPTTPTTAAPPQS